MPEVKKQQKYSWQNTTQAGLKVKAYSQKLRIPKVMTLKIKFNPEAYVQCLVKYRDQVQVPLQELLNETKEEINKALNKKIGLEDALE